MSQFKSELLISLKFAIHKRVPVKHLASFESFKTRPQMISSHFPDESNGKAPAKTYTKQVAVQTIQTELSPALTMEEAVDALTKNCAKIRVLDMRTGRWMELDGDASLIPHLRSLALGTPDADSGTFFRLVIKPETKPRQVLQSWKEISDYLGRGVRTVQRYEVTLGLPVRRASGLSRCAVLAFSDELDAWLQARPMQMPKPVVEPNQ